MLVLNVAMFTVLLTSLLLNAWTGLHNVHNVVIAFASLCTILGVLANRAAVRANGGRMPVFLDRNLFDEGEHHVVASSSTRLPWLCDWIHWCRRTWSPGDVLLILGCALSVGWILVRFVLEWLA
jgi:hypothetical protein